MGSQEPEINANGPTPSPQTSQAKPDSFGESFGKVERVGKYVLLLTASCAIPAYVAQKHNNGLTFLQFYLATAPFTSAVAIIALGMIRGWFKSLNIPTLLFVVTMILVVSTFSGMFLGLFAPGKNPLTTPTGNPYTLAFRLLSFYYTLYGAWTFLVSIAVGIFLAWAGGKMMWPHAENLMKGFTSKK